PMGNITTNSMGTYTYDPNHPYAVDTVTNSSGTTVYSASYDADGNMVTRNGSPITWTVDNLPASLGAAQGSSTFSYGPEHQRYYQSATFNGVSTDTTYIGGLFEVLVTQTSTDYRHNIIADGQVIAVHTIDQSGNATTDYLHYDHLGSVDTITDDSGNVIQTMSFDAFGLRRDAANWNYDLTTAQITALKNDTDRGYTFQEQLDNVALVDMNGRVYDPSIGRFISADPIVPEPLFSESFDRYAYVNNSPLVYTDPSGFDDWCPGQQPKAINQHHAVTRCELGPVFVTASPAGGGGVSSGPSFPGSDEYNPRRERE
ncbi:MAG: RHS repeat-associated core domain-containing protein, partial [Gammaproteobacteria bacterium]